MTYKEIVKYQKKLNAIWGSALNDNLFSYKVELFKQKKPTLMVLGSSRVVQMREQFFNSSFANCGLAMSHLNEGIMFLEEILKFHHPELILLGLDFWWFNDAHPQPPTFPQHNKDGSGNLLYKIRQPFVWLRNNKISLRQLMEVTLFGNTKNDITKYDNMGIAAIKYSQGFRKDGSFFDSKILFGLDPKVADIQFKITFSWIDKGGSRVEYGDRISPGRLQQFQKIMEICRGNNIPLIVFLPPMAPKVYQKMETMPREYAYIQGLRNYLPTLPLEAYDFHDISEVSRNDCEFFDGFHGGDVLSQKMLLSIVEKNPQSALRKYLNIPLMTAKIKEFSGHVLTKYHKQMYNLDETDFLHLGCKK